MFLHKTIAGCQVKKIILASIMFFNQTIAGCQVFKILLVTTKFFLPYILLASTRFTKFHFRLPGAVGSKILKTLPEAQRTQGIEFIT